MAEQHRSSDSFSTAAVCGPAPSFAISPGDKIAAPTPPVWTKKKVALAVVWTTLLVAGALALWHFGFLQELSNKDRLVAALRSDGGKGALICIAAQFVQVVIFAIPGEITQFAAGYVFGIWRGFLYSVLGIMLGSAFNFYFAQLIGRPALEKFVGRTTLETVDRLLNSAGGKSAIFRFPRCPHGRRSGVHRPAKIPVRPAPSTSGDRQKCRMLAAQAYAKTGESAQSRKLLAHLQQIARQRYVPALYFAAIYSALGDSNEAFRWLDKAYNEHCDYLVQIGNDPMADALRDDPRYNALLEKIGFVHQ